MKEKETLSKKYRQKELLHFLEDVVSGYNQFLSGDLDKFSSEMSLFLKEEHNDQLAMCLQSLIFPFGNDSLVKEYLNTIYPRLKEFVTTIETNSYKDCYYMFANFVENDKELATVAMLTWARLGNDESVKLLIDTVSITDYTQEIIIRSKSKDVIMYMIEHIKPASRAQKEIVKLFDIELLALVDERYGLSEETQEFILNLAIDFEDVDLLTKLLPSKYLSYWSKQVKMLGTTDENKLTELLKETKPSKTVQYHIMFNCSFSVNLYMVEKWEDAVDLDIYKRDSLAMLSDKDGNINLDELKKVADIAGIDFNKLVEDI